VYLGSVLSLSYDRFCDKYYDFVKGGDLCKIELGFSDSIVAVDFDQNWVEKGDKDGGGVCDNKFGEVYAVKGENTGRK
jgi:hypothetical protein